MFAITGNWVDLAFCGLIIFAILLYVGLQFYLDRHDVKFSSVRQMLDEFDKDDRPGVCRACGKPTVEPEVFCSEACYIEGYDEDL